MRVKHSLRLAPLAALLFLSGCCALALQVGWLREFRLVFGGSTAASAAVVAIFMGGLGAGNALLGRLADRVTTPLALYGRLEIGVAIAAGLSPFLIDLIREIYGSSGGAVTLGRVPATLLRLALTTLVLGLPTFLMGGTLPAIVAAATAASDRNRSSAATLYGLNTLGAVCGGMLATFILLQTVGTRTTIGLAAAANLSVGAIGIALSSRFERGKHEPSAIDEELDADPSAEVPPLLVYVSAGAVGFAFLLAELIWFRMLAPLLGGTTYTFGLILAVALFGIGSGGALYPLLMRKKSPTLVTLATTCALEAIFLGLPLAFGDRIAIFAAELQLQNEAGFSGAVADWIFITAIIVLPASIVSGVQFPVLIALLGSGRRRVGRQVGWIYAANTVGGIAGSLAGGFGLVPLLSAIGTWRAVILLLAFLAMVLVVFAVRLLRFQRIAVVAVSASAVVVAFAPGPTAVWRHSGIGAGRTGYPPQATANERREWEHMIRRNVIWERDGREAAVAIGSDDGLSVYVNGKSDGNAIRDAGTQIMLGGLGALLHGDARHCFVVGLGTGETAGWLAEVDSVRRVDVAEIEPSVDEMARRCAAVNFDVLNHTKVRMIYDDAREVLLTSPARYDLIVSEPSNPYRVGVSNLFTREFYRSVSGRLAPRGLFVQWLQAYEIDDQTALTVLATLRAEFDHVEVWQSKPDDLLLVCTQEPITHDAELLRARAAKDAYPRMLAIAWRATTLEGVLARYVAGRRTVDHLLDQSTVLLNTDDLNRVEYGFARSLGKQGAFDVDRLRDLAGTLDDDFPVSKACVDEDAVASECAMSYAILKGVRPAHRSSQNNADLEDFVSAYLRADFNSAIAAISRPTYRKSELPNEIAITALCQAYLGNQAEVRELAQRLSSFNVAEATLLRAIAASHARERDEAAALFSRGFLALRTDPWPLDAIVHRALATAAQLSENDPRAASQIVASLSKPFAAGLCDQHRRGAACLIASELDPDEAVPFVESFEPHVPWTERFLRLRLRTYGAVDHPLARSARNDLKEFLRAE